MEIIEAKLVEPAEPARRPWGFWATMGLSLAVIVTVISIVEYEVCMPLGM